MWSRRRNRFVLVSTAFVVSTATLAATASGAAVADEAVVDYCSQTLQDANLCLGYFTTDASQDPVTAAVLGALGAGNVAGATEFYLGVQQFLDSTQTAVIDTALDAAQSGAADAEDILYGFTDPIVPGPIVPDAGVDAGMAESSPEAKHGNCCATYNDTWHWDGRVINYGYCQQTPYGVYCESTGHFYADVRSNVRYFPDIYWDHYFSYKSGHRAYLNNLSVKMKRDVARKADPTVNKYSCSSGWVPIGCEQSRVSPRTTGHYYYDELNADVSCQCGKPTVHLQVQTRRWYIPSYSYPYYPAYYNGG